MASSSGKSDYSRELNPPALRKYSYEELSKATQHFSNNNWLGSGGFGDVFRGSLDSECVAIKKLKHKKYGEPEEIKCHKRVSQPILVKLIGYCHEGADKLLVLEYVPNKTLRHHLDVGASIDIQTALGIESVQITEPRRFTYEELANA
ncbi:proline-rich receptor-like protein kinase PERK15 isoform X2 [Manihot esculenta]|uniref:proline-rich receptor-like protein kinase PERK15 isoform X2 n=1 Tax=Manihot esculenta TaxID=3983 RepID=UPI000B5D8B8E|nr:proline-rich receptor-like protein kinase PERK15 isoform X2 [Manihot esculenta]XP_021630815.1 proline-rich receptor-like protein kinase PERK15 isoform X2 [Manihot esculenta]